MFDVSVFALRCQNIERNVLEIASGLMMPFHTNGLHARWHSWPIYDLRAVVTLVLSAPSFISRSHDLTRPRYHVFTSRQKIRWVENSGGDSRSVSPVELIWLRSQYHHRSVKCREITRMKTRWINETAFLSNKNYIKRLVFVLSCKLLTMYLLSSLSEQRPLDPWLPWLPVS